MRLALTGGDQAPSGLEGVEEAHLRGLVHVDLVVHDALLHEDAGRQKDATRREQAKIQGTRAETGASNTADATPGIDASIHRSELLKTPPTRR